MNIDEKISKRQVANREILKILADAIERHPEMRFGQLLYAIRAIYLDDGCDIPHVVDPFYIESVDMLDKIKREYLEVFGD